jgi:hypothetical protein
MVEVVDAARTKRDRLRRRAVRDLEHDARALIAAKKHEEALRMIEYMARNLPGPGRPQVRAGGRWRFAHYAGATTDNLGQPRCQRRGCRRHLRSDQPLACSPECAEALIDLALLNLSRLGPELQRSDREQETEQDVEAFIEERLALEERR